MFRTALIAIFICVILAVSAGFVFKNTPDQTPETKTESALQTPQNNNNENSLTEVRIRQMEAQPFVNDIVVTGRTQASRQVDLKAETDGRIVSLMFKKGEHVKKGAVLAKMEVRDRAARVQEAEQLLNQREIQFNASKELENRGFNSKVRLAESRAQLESAKAALKEARVELSKINLKAPFDGVIDDQYIEIGDFVSRGDNAVSIVDLNPVEITAFVTEENVIQIKQGDKARAVFLNNQVVEGEISFVSSVADPESRTFRVEISAPNEDRQIKEGLTAELRIPLPEKQAYKISPSILSLADDGTVGLKLLDDDDIVRFVPVKMLRDTTEFLWVSGLPDTARVVTVGQDFVTPGQKVKPVESQGDGLL